ncbi:hypothetical protein PHLGIDRAFT_129342 [Phlebiopsis gigantea 11061_1 CR5-6]|uniref:Peptidase C14 caspase domain-containing protein n=1 Tax=Phlebiopsis gigantea (strain 11061_1 CR5-6) TaxID=745531 RepID=A0A0C3S3Z3_PHLG1|nr:hypothetical protein PHLGIDRAFT_129342 [Phlebiopsis gigantea 11061_1 CR5-6]
MNLRARTRAATQTQLQGESSPLSTPTRDRTRDKALLIGIEYRWHQGYDEVTALSNPHKDVQLLKTFLIEHEGYLEQNITVLVDGTEDQLMEPSRANILREIDSFVADMREGDRRVFFFGGHGTQLLNRTGSELDGKDEAILTSRHCGWPVDEKNKPLPNDTELLDVQLHSDHPHYQKLRGVIVDNELRKYLVNRLPAGSQLVAFFDTCHSATMLDLDSVTWKRRATNVVAVVPKGYKLIRNGIRSATFTQLSPAALVPKSIPGKKLLIRSLKRNQDLPPTPRSKSWVQKGVPNVSHGIEQPAVISFSSAEDDQSTWDTSVTMITVVIDYLKRDSAHERNRTPRDLELYLRGELEKSRIQSFRAKASLNPLKYTPARCQRLIVKLMKMQVPRANSLNVKDLKEPLRL